MTPRVSVIIATYNRSHLLKTAIDSVLDQTFTDYELLVVDDGSADDTATLVRAYGDRVRYLHQENQGKSVALNNALATARGEWIAFLDSDDYWLPEKLEWQFRAIEKFKNQDCGACFTDGQFVNNPKMDTTAFKFYGREYLEHLCILSNPVHTLAESPIGLSVVTLVCRAALIQKIGGFDPDLRFTEDYDFVFRLALTTNYCLVNQPLVVIDRSVATGRHTGASAIWDRVDFRLDCERYRYEKWLRLADNRPDVRKIISRHLRAVHSARANWYLANQKYELAQTALATAMRYQLTPSLAIKCILSKIAPKSTGKFVLRHRGFNADVF